MEVQIITLIQEDKKKKKRKWRNNIKKIPLYRKCVSVVNLTCEQKSCSLFVNEQDYLVKAIMSKEVLTFNFLFAFPFIYFLFIWKM